jgi:hypothetical protein
LGGYLPAARSRDPLRAPLFDYTQLGTARDLEGVFIPLPTA